MQQAPDRRDRLKYVLSQIAVARGGEAPDMESESESSDEEVSCYVVLVVCLISSSNPGFYAQEEEFYTPGTIDLLDARRKMAEYSLPRYSPQLY